VLPRPTSGVVTLGGTFERGREEYRSDAADVAMIWDLCCKLCPELVDARTIRIDEWAGMRPGRKADVRLEMEAVSLGGRRVAVVHNYGHAGCGHSLHWGCAMDATALAARARAEMTTGKWAGFVPGTALPLAKLGRPPVIMEGPHTVVPRIMGHVPRVLPDPADEAGDPALMGTPAAPPASILAGGTRSLTAIGIAGAGVDAALAAVVSALGRPRL
jgi:hypothetical protein